MNKSYAFDGTFAFLPTHRAKQKNAKEPLKKRTKTYQLDGEYNDRKEGRTANSTYKKLAVQWLNEALCFVSSFVVVESLVLPCLLEAVRQGNRQLLVAAKRQTV